MLVYQTCVEARAYAHRVPSVAAARIPRVFIVVCLFHVFGVAVRHGGVRRWSREQLALDTK